MTIVTKIAVNSSVSSRNGASLLAEVMPASTSHESCWHNIDGVFNSGTWKGDVYSLSFEDYEKKSTLTYDRMKPESGFSVHRKTSYIP